MNEGKETKMQNMNTTDCNTCKKKCKKNDFIKCATCKQTLCIDGCSHVSWKRYDLMATEKKLTWRCNKCIRKPPITANTAKPTAKKVKRAISSPRPSLSTPGPSHQNITIELETEKPADHSLSAIQLASVDDIRQLSIIDSGENVTIRKKGHTVNIPTKNSFDSLSTCESLGSEDEQSRVNETACSFSRSKSCLDLNKITLRNELDSLKEEVTNLRVQLESAESEIESMLSENCNLKREINRYVKKVEELTKLCLNTSTTGRRKNRKNRKNNNQTMPNIEVENELQDRFLDTNITSTPIIHGKVIDATEQPVSLLKTKKTRVDIFSNFKRRDLANLTESYLDQHQLCRYTYPGADIHQMLAGIETKLQDFTLDDYCVVFIGENDFTVSKNLHCIIDFIREKLLLVQHTNVMIVLPTYKSCSTSLNLFNSRIESFNNLLYLDNIRHKYAYLIDSNKNLDYSPNMFNFNTGRPNSKAMKIICTDLADLISLFGGQERNKDKDTFFRDYE